MPKHNCSHLCLSCLLLWLIMIPSGCVRVRESVIEAEPPLSIPNPPGLPPSFTTPGLPYPLTFTRDGDIYMIDPDGTERNLLGKTPEIERGANWSPDGSYIALSTTTAGNSDITIVPMASLNVPLTKYTLSQTPHLDETNPTWSPDGRRLAYSAYRSGTWRIEVVDLSLFKDYRAPLVSSTRTVTPITQSLRLKAHPVWSPDGNSIAYTSDVGDRWQVTVTTIGQNRHRSFPGTETALPNTYRISSTAYPAWSPDGARMAFASTHSGNWDIYLVNADGTGWQRLTSHPAPDWHPAWSPDGKWIAFASGRSGSGDLYVVRNDGTELSQLTESPTPEDDPSWRPPPASGM